MNKNDLLQSANEAASRLHSQNKKLEAINVELLEALKKLVLILDSEPNLKWDDISELIDAREVIKKATS